MYFYLKLYSDRCIKFKKYNDEKETFLGVLCICIPE